MQQRDQNKLDFRTMNNEGTLSLPIISLKKYLHDESKVALKEVAHAVDDTLTNSGAFFIVDHGIDTKLMEQVLVDMKTFFEMPLEKKLVYQLMEKNQGRGYIPFATQNSHAFMGRFNKPNDPCERFVFGPTKPLISGFVQDPTDFIESWSPNIYASCFRCSIVNYYEAIDKLAHHFMRILSVAMGQQENFLENICNRASPMLKATYYPPADRLTEDQPRLGEHTDMVPMSIILQDDTKNGVKVQNVDGQWVYVNGPPGGLLILTGDCTAIFTNNRWPAVPHFVPFPDCEKSKMKSRISIPYFLQLNNKIEVKTLPKFLDENGKSFYKPTTYWDIMHHKMKGFVEANVSY